MNSAVVLLAVLGAAVAQLKPVAHYSSPAVYHYSQPAAYHVAQPAAYVAQPAVYHAAQPAVYHAAQPSFKVAQKPIAIISQNAQQSVDGSFNYDFQSENGIQAQAAGSVRALGPDQIAQSVQGSYSYTSPDGTPITVNYVADENGFHAEGAHLPTPPPIPEAIARSLQILPTLEEFERQEAARSGKKL